MCIFSRGLQSHAVHQEAATYLFSQVPFHFQTEERAFFFSLEEKPVTNSHCLECVSECRETVVTVTHLHPHSGLCVGAKIFTFLAGTAHSRTP